MQKKFPAFVAFIILCLMAFGGGNVLRQKLNPDEFYAKNPIFEPVGRFIKGMVRGPGIITSADANDPGLVEYGSQVYTAQCAECHGTELQGQPNWRVRKADGLLPAPPHDATGHSWHHSDALLFAYTRDGGQPLMPDGMKSGMPAFGEILNRHDIWAVLAYIKSTWPQEIQDRQAKQNPP